MDKQNSNILVETINNRSNHFSKKELSQLRQVAETAARKAGDIQLSHFGCMSGEVLENRPRDLKILVDRLCEKAVYDIIRKHYPDHSIISEESGLEVKESEFIWIIDPLDGTLNYFFGLPLFCSCVACYWLPNEFNLESADKDFYLLEHATPLVGVVYSPVINNLFSAATGLGATCNDIPMVQPSLNQIEDAMVGISFGSSDQVMKTMETLNTILVRRVKKVRIFGSTGLDLAHVASGQLSALIQIKVRIWDIAAALVILKESGGQSEVVQGPYGGWQFLAATPGIFSDLKEIMTLSNLDKADIVSLSKN